jgi:ketosteroid isomerase-like protein
MKRIVLKPAAFLVATLISVSVCAQNNDAVRSKIEKINKELQQAMLTGNTSTAMAYYSENAISMPNYGKMAQGIEAIKKSNEQMMASGMKITAFTTNIGTLSRCENNIAEVGTYTIRFTMEGVGGEMTDNGKYLTIWEERPDGSLKIVLEMWNTDAYPAGQ